MCAMTGLNIQFLVLFGDGVVRWHVFIRILRYYSTKLAGSIVKILCKTKVLAGTATLSRNDLKELCNTKCCGWSGTLPSFGTECHLLPHRGEGMCNYNLIKDENHPSSQSSLIIKGVSNSHPELVSGSCDMLKHGGQFDVLHDKTNPPHPQSLPREIEAEKLTSHFTLHTSLRRKAAFTLAEVLITLGIIGVVAAMTMPALIQNARNRELESALKKSASVIAQALDMYKAENGVPITSDVSTHNLKPAIIKYFKVLQDCGEGYNDADSACIKNYNDPDRNSTTYKNFSGNNTIFLNDFDDGQFVLTDGTLILLNNYETQAVIISVDVNGYKKRPNRLGQDLFMFQLNEEGKLLPMGVKESKYYSSNDAYCSATSTSQFNGSGCTYKALSEPEFWKKLP